MKDTPPEVEARYREMIMSRSPAERLTMATRMFMTAKSLVRAGLKASGETIPPEEMPGRIFLRFYGHEFGPAEKERILQHLKTVYENRENRGETAY